MGRGGSSIKIRLYGLDKDRIIFFILQGAVGIIAIITGKVIALNFAPEVFGRFSLLMGATTLYTSFLINPLIQSFKYSLTTKSNHHSLNFYTSLISSINVFSLIASGILVSFWLNFTSLFLLGLYLLVQALNQILISFFNITFRHSEFNKSQVLLNIVNLFIIILYGVVKSPLVSENALILSLFVSTIISTTYLFYILKKSGINVAFIAKSYNLKLYREEFSEIYSFAMPLVLLAFFSWTVSQIDRYILYFYLSAKEVGSYTAAYGLGSKFFLLFVAPFLLLLKPLVFQIKKTGSTPLSGFKVTLKYWLLYFSISCLVEIFILLYYNSLGSIFLSEKYIEGFKVIPYISAGYLLLTSINFIEISFYAWNKTKYILFHYIFGAVTNIILNLLLVPRYGIIGSGISSFFSFSFQFLIASVLFAKLITKEKTFSQ